MKPGNIREFKYVIEHSVIACKGSKPTLARLLQAASNSIAKSLDAFRTETLQAMEREQILQVLKQCRGKLRSDGSAAQ